LESKIEERWKGEPSPEWHGLATSEGEKTGGGKKEDYVRSPEMR